jgi:hypothetical protein
MQIADPIPRRFGILALRRSPSENPMSLRSIASPSPHPDPIAFDLALYEELEHDAVTVSLDAAIHLALTRMGVSRDALNATQEERPEATSWGCQHESNLARLRRDVALSEVELRHARLRALFARLNATRKAGRRLMAIPSWSQEKLFT